MGTAISTLEVGQRIHIRARGGYPATEWSRVDYILSVSGNSAITETGVQLAGCNDDGLNIEVLPGKKKTEFKPSPRARKLMEKAELGPEPGTTWKTPKSPWGPLAMATVVAFLVFFVPSVGVILKSVSTIVLAAVTTYYAFWNDRWITLAFFALTMFSAYPLYLLLV